MAEPEPQAEEPKAEEPKAEAPKAEEPKAEEPVTEQSKDKPTPTEAASGDKSDEKAQPKAEEPKAEEPKGLRNLKQLNHLHNHQMPQQQKMMMVTWKLLMPIKTMTKKRPQNQQNYPQMLLLY
eukprot:436275_1